MLDDFLKYLLYGVLVIWSIPAFIQTKSSSPLKDLFIPIGFGNIAALALSLMRDFGLLNITLTNSVIYIMTLTMLSILVNPNTGLYWFKHSFRKFWIFAAIILTSHVLIYYIIQAPKYDVLLIASLFIGIFILMILACKQRLELELKLNIYIFLLLIYALKSALQYLLYFYGGHIYEQNQSLAMIIFETAIHFNWLDLVFIIYFSFAKYEQSKNIFKPSNHA
jgi:hypothetical protein